MTAQHTHLEKKRATIVCADIHGIFRPQEDESIDQSAGLMNTCNDIIESVANYYGGKIIHFTGKSAILAFEEKVDSTGNRNNALAAAFEISEKIAEISKEIPLNVPLELQAGIHSGTVLFGHIGPSANKQFTVIGETVDIASKIREMANKGQILVGSDTFDQNKSSFDFQALEPIFIKGKPDPLPIYKVLQRKKKEFAPKDQAGRSIYSEMVGREAEMEQLKAVLVSLTKGKGGIVNIIGLPGTGKSRLVAEIKKEKVVDQLVWFEGRALSHGQNLSYHPIAGIIKSWAGILEEENPQSVEFKLRNAIERILPDEVERIFAFMGRFIGMALNKRASEILTGINPDSMDKLMRKALRDLLIKSSSNKPIVIAIEDLHWADRSSMEMLRSLFALSSKQPILFIVIMRPGYEETSGVLVKYLEANHAEMLQTIEVTNLNPARSKELIGNLILSGQLPMPFLQELIAKTEGNPFFIEEVLRSLIDQGAIEFSDKVFKINHKIYAVKIPETINEVLLSRVEKLDEKTRNLLDTASVIGRNFYFKVLDEAAETIGEVSERLQYLKNMQFIQESGGEENLEYVFKHALAHQAAYDSMMEKKRKSLHLKIAESIEKVFPERINEFYGTLAMHYSKAENFIKAEEYLVKAGDESMNSAASTEAIDYFKEAFKTYLKNSGDEPDPKKVTIFYSKIGDAYQLGGKNKEAIEYYEKVLRHYKIEVPTTKTGILFSISINFVIMLVYTYFPWTRFNKKAGDQEKWLLQVIYFYQRALYSFDSRRWFQNAVISFRFFSRYSFDSNEYSQATFSAYSILFNWTGISLSVARRIIKLSSIKIQSKSILVQHEHHTYSKMHQFLEGDWRTEPNMENIQTTFLESGDIFNFGPFLLFCGFISIELGLRNESFKIIDNMLKIGEEFESDHSLAQHHRLKAVALYKFREFDQIYPKTTKGIEYTLRTGHRGMLQIIYCMRLISATKNNDLESARKLLPKIEKLMPPLKRIKIWHSTYFLAKAYLLTEEFRRDPENKSLKSQLICTCKSSIKQAKMVPNNLIESHRVMGNAMWMTGKKKQAINHYVKSINEAERVNGKLELSRTLFELGKRLSSNGMRIVNGLSGEAYLKKARSIFLEMGLEYDLKELERFESRGFLH